MQKLMQKRFSALLLALVALFAAYCEKQPAPTSTTAASQPAAAAEGPLTKGQFAKVTEAAALRSKPSTSAKHVECSLQSVGQPNSEKLLTKGWQDQKGDNWRYSKGITSAPAGAVFEVLDATKAPEKVQSWTNYWYKVKVTNAAISVDGTKAEFDCAEGDIWIFGEFLKSTGANFQKYNPPKHPDASP